MGWMDKLKEMFGGGSATSARDADTGAAGGTSTAGGGYAPPAPTEHSHGGHAGGEGGHAGGSHAGGGESRGGAGGGDSGTGA